MEDLHPVHKRRRDIMGGIGCCNKKYVGKVEGYFQVMIAEITVLLRVQYLQESGRRVSPEIHAHLVDLIQQNHGVSGTGLAHDLNNLPGHSPDISAAVSANFRLVPDPAKRKADKFPVKRPGDRTGQ